MYYQNETDQTLVMLTLAGEQQAYEVLVTRYQKTVIAAAASVTKNHFMAEDAAQDAFVTAWMKLNVLQDPQKFAPWVCRIAKNCAINMITRYRGFMPLDAVDNLAFPTIPSRIPPRRTCAPSKRTRLAKAWKGCPRRSDRLFICTTSRIFRLPRLPIACVCPRGLSNGSSTTAENDSERSFAQ